MMISTRHFFSEVLPAFIDAQFDSPKALDYKAQVQIFFNQPSINTFQEIPLIASNTLSLLCNGKIIKFNPDDALVFSRQCGQWLYHELFEFCFESYALPDRRSIPIFQLMLLSIGIESPESCSHIFNLLNIEIEDTPERITQRVKFLSGLFAPASTEWIRMLDCFILSSGIPRPTLQDLSKCDLRKIALGIVFLIISSSVALDETWLPLGFSSFPKKSILPPIQCPLNSAGTQWSALTHISFTGQVVLRERHPNGRIVRVDNRNAIHQREDLWGAVQSEAWLIEQFNILYENKIDTFFFEWCRGCCWQIINYIDFYFIPLSEYLCTYTNGDELSFCGQMSKSLFRSQIFVWETLMQIMFPIVLKNYPRLLELPLERKNTLKNLIFGIESVRLYLSTSQATPKILSPDEIVAKLKEISQKFLAHQVPIVNIPELVDHLKERDQRLMDEIIVQDLRQIFIDDTIRLIHIAQKNYSDFVHAQNLDRFEVSLGIEAGYLSRTRFFIFTGRHTKNNICDFDHLISSLKEIKPRHFFGTFEEFKNFVFRKIHRWILEIRIGRYAGESNHSPVKYLCNSLSRSSGFHPPDLTKPAQYKFAHRL